MLCFVASDGSTPKLNERFVFIIGTSAVCVWLLSFEMDIVWGLVDWTATVFKCTGRAVGLMLLCELNELSLSSSSVPLCDVPQLAGMAFVRARSESSSRFRNL